MTDEQQIGEAVDQAKLNEKRKKEASERQDEINDLRALMKMPQFRRLAWRLMARCRTFGSVMSGNSYTFYNSGMQDVGHFILAEIIEADPDAYLEMIKEQRNKGVQ